MPKIKRIYLTIGCGAAVWLLGIFIFLIANDITANVGNGYSVEQQSRDEVLWCALGGTLVISGVVVSAIGLNAWCRRDGE